MKMGDESMTRLMGDQREIQVERALAELRSGRPVLLNVNGQRFLVLGAEGADDAMLASLVAINDKDARLVLSQPRLRLLGSDMGADGILPLKGLGADEVHSLIVNVEAHLNGHAPHGARLEDEAALEMVRLAYLLPAALVVASPEEAVDASSLITVEIGDLEHYREHVINRPKIVSRAPVPLEDFGDTEFVVFRGGEGMRDQVAVVIGQPRTDEPVYVRLHSACLTGDLFSSLKCDCGDQLRGSARFMAENGGGIILYLDQEGRGNGIANKIRAYRLQHSGYTTYDADAILGFGLDQRGFDFAGAMLKELGYRSIKLLTNNPNKVEALKVSGLDIVSSHRAKARLNLHNVAYLAAKRDQAGHLIEDKLD